MRRGKAKEYIAKSFDAEKTPPAVREFVKEVIDEKTSLGLQQVLDLGDALVNYPMNS